MNPPAVNPSRVLLSTADAARYIGIPARTLANWRYLSPHMSPPYLRLGGKVWYSAEDLDRWLTARRVPCGEVAGNA